MALTLERASGPPQLDPHAGARAQGPLNQKGDSCVRGYALVLILIFKHPFTSYI